MVAITALATAALASFALAVAGVGARAEPKHAIAMHGVPAMPPGFSARAYVNPDAPKGGRLTHGVLGTFDSLNPFVVKGIAPPYIRGYVVESLLARGYDEPFTLYGLLADRVETDDARSFVTFHTPSGGGLLRRQAGHGGRRDFFVGDPARQGPPELPHLLRQGEEGRSSRRRTVRFDLSDRTTTANCR